MSARAWPTELRFSRSKAALNIAFDDGTPQARRGITIMPAAEGSLNTSPR